MEGFVCGNDIEEYATIGGHGKVGEWVSWELEMRSQGSGVSLTVTLPKRFSLFRDATKMGENADLMCRLMCQLICRLICH